jgi:hypothetical protein
MNNQSQAAIDSLKAKAARLEAENTHLKAENRRLSGNGPLGDQTRQCVHCARNLPDGPSYFPGYLEEMAEDSAAELQRYLCVYCR